MDLAVVGSIAIDSVKTPFGERDDVLGGAASYLSTVASYFASVGMVGVVGEDFPSEHVSFLEGRKIDLSGLQRVAGSSFRWKGKYETDMNVAHTLDTQLNVFADFDPVLPDNYRQAPLLALGNIDPKLQLNVLKQMRDPKLIACDTMNYWIEGHRPALLETLAHVDLLSINDAEARQLSGEYNLVQAAQAIHRMGPKILVIKRGEYGALLFTQDGIFAAPAYPLEEIFDPTGAGDSFAGGLMGHLARSKEISTSVLRQGVILGSAMASFAVEKFSLDRIRDLTEPEIEKRFKAFKNLTHFEDAL